MFKIKNKLRLLLLIPISGLIYFSAELIADKKQIADEMSLVQVLAKLSIQMSRLVHELQKERGLSAGFLGSDGKSFMKKLESQKKLTDQKKIHLDNFINNMGKRNLPDSIKKSLKNAYDQLNNMYRFRQKVRVRQISIDDMIQFYSDIDQAFFHTVMQITGLTHHVPLATMMHAYLNFLQAKDKAGLERAVGVYIFTNTDIHLEFMDEFKLLITEEKAYIKVFKTFATLEQRQFYDNILLQDSEVNKEIRKLRKILTIRELKGKILANLNTYLGYGGLIHHFKNYVLRGDQKYIDLFMKKYSTIIEVIDKWQRIEKLSSIERSDLKNLKKTIKKYKVALVLVIRLKKEKKSVVEIDSIVKIDDKLAIHSLNRLSQPYDYNTRPEEWYRIMSKYMDGLGKVEEKIFIDIKKMVSDLKDTARNGFIYYSIGALATILVTFLISFVITRRIINPLELAVEIAHRLAKGERDINIEVDSRDETGQLLTAMKNMAYSIKLGEETLQRSERRLSQAQAISHLGNWSWDMASAKLDMSDELHRIMGYGYKRFDLSYDDLISKVHPDDRVRVIQTVSDMLAEKIVEFDLDFRIFRLDGEERIIHAQGQLRFDNHRKFLRMVGVGQDITERMKVHTERDLLAQFPDKNPNPVLRVNGDYIILYANRASETLLGHWDSKVGDLFHESCHQTIKEVLNTGKSTSIEMKVKQFTYSLLIVPVEGVDNVYIYGEDITAYKQAEETLQKSKELAEAASLAKSNFLRTIGHELRTPMNGFIGMTELTLRTELNSEQRDYLEMARDSADSLLTVLDSLMDYTKIEAGKMTLNLIEFNLRESLEKRFKVCSVQAKQKKIDLTYDILEDVPNSLTGDIEKLLQVLVNLVSNSIKFTQKGKISIHIAKEIANPEHVNGKVDLHFKVSDTGIGIPLDKQDLIFDPFTQVDGSTSRSYEGTGLGLNIAKDLVTLMGGTLRVESDLGKGSRFYFTVRLGLQDK